jgi:hypothetical protein
MENGTISFDAYFGLDKDWGDTISESGPRRVIDRTPAGCATPEDAASVAVDRLDTPESATPEQRKQVLIRKERRA